MELVLIKNKGAIQVYQGTLDHHEDDLYFLATVSAGKIMDLVVYKIDEVTGKTDPVDEYTKGALFDILVEEHIQDMIA